METLLRLRVVPNMDGVFLQKVRPGCARKHAHTRVRAQARTHARTRARTCAYADMRTQTCVHKPALALAPVLTPARSSSAERMVPSGVGGAANELHKAHDSEDSEVELEAIVDVLPDHDDDSASDDDGDTPRE